MDGGEKGSPVVAGIQRANVVPDGEDALFTCTR
jgi:hypothetical protein